MTTFLLISISCVLGFLLALGVLIRSYLAVVTVENVSMSPALEHGDRVLIMRHCPARWLRKGHIVLIWPSRTSPTEPTLFDVKPYIKRIIGLGGETLTISSPSAGGATRVQLPQDANSRYSQQTWHIPKGHIFVRGDNQTHSLDSLSWGPIPERSVLGVVLLKLPRKALYPPPHLDSSQNPPTIGLAAGQDAPPFTAQTLNRETVTLATYSGRAVAFLFFAPSEFCRKVISLYADLGSKAAESGVTIIFVSSTGVQATRPFVEELHINAPVLFAPRASNHFLRDYNVTGTPAYCLVNAQGKVQSSGYVNLGWGEWRALVESWVGQEFSVAGGL